MSNRVYFMDLRASTEENLLQKLDRLLTQAGLANIARPRELVAVKLHFGELGNTAYIRPVFLRQVVLSLKALGAVPFLTDANTLYAGTRGDAPHHLVTAIQNGFAHAVVEAPLVIADGLRGRSETAVTIKGRHFKEVYIGAEIMAADALLSVAHFKGHELSGFGGTIKNLGMGCASRRGKMAQHADLAPEIDSERCQACGACAAHCSQGAISVQAPCAAIDPEKCIGCGECILICPEKAITIQWTESIPVFLEKMVEYTAGVLKDRRGKALFLNFLTDVSPACDCYAHNDAPIVPNIGILASLDPVAVDQAAADLVNGQPALSVSCLKTHTAPGEDKFRGIYPDVDWEIQLAYAEDLGLGNRRYDLIPI